LRGFRSIHLGKIERLILIDKEGSKS